MSQVDVDLARFNMIEQQVRPWEVLDQDVLDVLASTPRERFVPEGYNGISFADTEVPLGHGQAMMAPRLEGRLLQSLRLAAADQVLEVGTGSGYLAACLGRMARKVESLEIFEDLAKKAQVVLSQMDVSNVRVRVADVFDLDLQEQGYDAIAVTGSLPQYPQDLPRWLALGGRMFVVVGEGTVMEGLLVTRVGDNDWVRESLFETCLPALVNAPRPERFVF
jgi:protein-L-isoaspartate(D-aspartate) O-methyltransferase